MIEFPVIAVSHIKMHINTMSYFSSQLQLTRDIRKNISTKLRVKIVGELTVNVLLQFYNNNIIKRLISYIYQETL